MKTSTQAKAPQPRSGTERKKPKQLVEAAAPAAATRRTRSPDAANEVGAGNLGMLARKARSLRNAAGLTLQELSSRSGISQSALSKIENGQLSPTYEKIASLAKGLQVDVGELFSDSTPGAPVGRRGVTLRGQGVPHSSAQYDYEVLCADVLGKQFLPLLTTVKAHSLQDFPSLPRHDGEEFVYVVEGEIMLHTEFYGPLRLRSGDCCYFDSNMRHGLVSAGEKDAVVLWICSKNVTLKTDDEP
jgi:transcriptional regulator with XRE-family HTH domain